MSFIRYYKLIMTELTPQTILSNISREECIRKLKELPTITYGDKPPTLSASVLIPLCVINGEVNLLYTLRSSNLSSHSGEVSFPGGKSDKDETVIETALRETEEEIGISRGNIEIWSPMSSFQGANHVFLITPVIGVIKNFNMADLKPNESEVSEVFTVPLQHFCNPEFHGHFTVKSMTLPVFTYKHYKIWGITALMTHFFLMHLLPESVYKIDMFKRKYELEDLLHKKTKL